MHFLARGVFNDAQVRSLRGTHEEALTDFPLTPRQAHETERDLARRFYTARGNLFRFVKDLGIAPNVQDTPHREVCRFVDPLPAPDGRVAGKRKKIVLLPRGTYKSFVGTIGLSLREIVRRPDVRITIASETYKLAKKHAGVVKQFCEATRGPFFDVFGTLKGEAGWTEDSFTVNTRTKTLREPTVFCAGQDVTSTGMHPDIVMLDDPVSVNTIKTPEALENTWGWFGELMAQLEPGNESEGIEPGQLYVFATIHHYADVYARIKKELGDQFDILSRGAYDGPVVTDSNGETGPLFFPVRLTHEFLREQEKILGSRMFAAFYLNRAVSTEETLLQPEQIQIVEENDIPEGLRLAMLTDTATSENDRSCLSAIVVVGMDASRRAYVLAVELGHFKPDDFRDRFFDLFSRWRPSPCLFEKIGLNSVYKALIDAEARRRGFHPYLVDVPGRTQTTKWQRIQSLQPLFEQNMILFSRTVAESKSWAEIHDELTGWPNVTLWDFLDALSDLNAKSKTGALLIPAATRGSTSAPAMTNGRYRRVPKPRSGRAQPWWERRPFPGGVSR